VSDRFEGVVKAWNDEEGFGVIESPNAPGDCFFFWGVIEAEGYRTAWVGQRVTFTCERARQDGCEWNALSVRPIPPADDQPASD
jgi:CspA family cold shock protein